MLELLTGIEPVNLLITNEVLYRLSYSSKCANRIMNVSTLALKMQVLRTRKESLKYIHSVKRSTDAERAHYRTDAIIKRKKNVYVTGFLQSLSYPFRPPALMPSIR